LQRIWEIFGLKGLRKRTKSFYKDAKANGDEGRKDGRMDGRKGRSEGFSGLEKEWRNTVTVISLCIHTKEWENLDTSTVPESQLVSSMSRRYYIVCRQMAMGNNKQYHDPLLEDFVC
jgi:hypothetical protein